MRLPAAAMFAPAAQRLTPACTPPAKSYAETPPAISTDRLKRGWLNQRQAGSPQAHLRCQVVDVGCRLLLGHTVARKHAHVLRDAVPQHDLQGTSTRQTIYVRGRTFRCGVNREAVLRDAGAQHDLHQPQQRGRAERGRGVGAAGSRARGCTRSARAAAARTTGAVPQLLLQQAAQRGKGGTAARVHCAGRRAVCACLDDVADRSLV